MQSVSVGRIKRGTPQRKGDDMVPQGVTEMFTSHASTLLHRTESYSTIIQERVTELLSGEVSQNRSVELLASWLEQWLDIDYIDDIPPLHRGILELGLTQIDWQVIAREFVEALEDTQP